MLELQENELKSLQGQLSYTNNVLKNNTLTEWEVKEYTQLLNSLKEDVKNQEQLIITIKDLN